tara:strand:- start:604 stop:1140 length:537 start_codon:yes stop_codon:yes gene_type:complete
MRITISGTPGSGKSVVCRFLCKKLNLEYYGSGELIRNFAKRKKLNLIELSNFLEKNKNIDKNFNEDIKKFNTKNNFILDSRLGFLFIKKGINIFLDADLNLRSKRIFKDKRKLESFKDVEEVKNQIKNRLSLERERFKKLYDVDFTNLKHYDLVIDTTGMNVKLISRIILEYLKKNDI